MTQVVEFCSDDSVPRPENGFKQDLHIIIEITSDYSVLGQIYLSWIVGSILNKMVSF